MNVTATEPAGPGFVTVWPCDKPMPTVSNLNLVAGETRPNAVDVTVAFDGTVCFYSTTPTHLIADVAGYVTSEPEAGVRTFLADPEPGATPSAAAPSPDFHRWLTD
jgi:hypothetical protein